MNLKEKEVVICSIVRNAKRGLERNVPVVHALCSRFRDYRIVIFENDSTDGTDRFLEKWAAQDQKVSVSCRRTGIRTIPKPDEVSCNPFFSAWRIEKMAAFRNQYLSFVEEQGWNPDFLVVVDLDVARLDLQGIL